MYFYFTFWVTFLLFTELIDNYSPQLNIIKLLILKTIKMKKTTIITTMMGLLILILISCNSKRDEVFDQLSSVEFSEFKTNFPNLSSKISFNDIQKVVINSDNTKTTSNMGVTFPVIDNKTVIGRYIGLSDETKGVYFDLSNYTNQITAYDVHNPSNYLVIQMTYNPDNDKYEPSLNNLKSYWCEISCCLGAMAIAASDGPSPLMDILAATYCATCIAECNQ